MEAYRVLSKEDTRANYDAQYAHRKSRFEDLGDMHQYRQANKYNYSHMQYVQEKMKAQAREKYYEE